MYQDELYREAKQIVQGRQEWVRDLATFWLRLKARFGAGVAQSPATDLRLH